MNCFNLCKVLFISGLLTITSAFSALAQDANLSLRVEVNKALASSQSINIQSLVANNGRGSNLFRMYLRNENASEYANNLYFEILIRSDKRGLLVEARQVNGQPFSLNPGQQVYATNNNISNGLPGVEEIIQFSGGLTSEGRRFVNKLQGGTSLPPDRYTIEINIYQGSDQQVKVASALAEMGSHIVEDTRDFYLLSPGDALGADARISNAYPNFQWQGASGNRYRLLVVESKENESPQSLLNGAESTPPTRANAASGKGSLVNYEMLDVVINRSSFQYPSYGVQSLEDGKTYYWRIINKVRTSSGEEERKSEIWSFTLAGSGSGNNLFMGSPALTRALKAVLGDRFQKFSERGYRFKGVEIDGQVLRGNKALQKLMELSRRAEEGDVSIVIEEQ